MIEFTKIIRQIDAELKPEWQPDAFKWADKTLGMAHDNAVNRFENAILECGKRYDWVSLQKEADIYKADILRILRAYKKIKQVNEQQSFFESLESLADLADWSASE